MESKNRLNKILLLSVIYFFECIKMNEIVNKFLLASDTFMPEMHLKQPVFTKSACRSSTKNKESIEKSMKTRNTDFIYFISMWYGLW